MRCKCREKGIGNPPVRDGECLICRRPVELVVSTVKRLFHRV